ncbi:MGH1-like glycoside hydrolase domain-containing protein [Amaricoccus tamworthensis]|uniref:MGH1-like glycoside hydrolase domain-containing protein n=1 Tax=Amaricoccus tamworthensis TaxID=57002 RepID=UPI003C7DF410
MATIEELDEQAREILRRNDRGGYSVPTAGLYPYQWNWDSAFSAYGYAEFDIDRAWTELETLFSGQWDNGMVPHILFHQADDGYFPGPDVWGAQGHGPIDSSGISQPPVAAAFARRIHDLDPSVGAERVGALFEPMLKWHRWFMKCRGESGAICITHPWESGRDNAPSWDKSLAAVDASNVGPYVRRDTGHVDASMRPTKYDYDRYIAIVNFGRDNNWDEDVILTDGPFRVADPTMTFTLLRSHRDLSYLGQELGRDTSEVDGWIEELESGAASLWNETIGAYDTKDLRTGEFGGTASSASFLNWYGGVENGVALDTLKQFNAGTKYGVASHDPRLGSFDPKRYWRGPVWAVVNYLVGSGLGSCGHMQEAEKIRQDTAELISKNGFAEYYDPNTGEPAGGGSFSWTAAVWLSWASPSAGEGN